MEVQNWSVLNSVKGFRSLVCLHLTFDYSINFQYQFSGNKYCEREFRIIKEVRGRQNLVTIFPVITFKSQSRSESWLLQIIRQLPMTSGQIWFNLMHFWHLSAARYKLTHTDCERDAIFIEQWRSYLYLVTKKWSLGSISFLKGKTLMKMGGNTRATNWKRIFLGVDYVRAACDDSRISQVLFLAKTWPFFHA